MHTSFELAGRLKASQEIIKADHMDKSCKLLVWILGQNTTFALVFLPCFFHPSRLFMPENCAFSHGEPGGRVGAQEG